MDIGQTLYFFRNNYQQTRKEFVKGVISTSYYAKVERDKSHISATLLIHLLEVNNISLKEFYLVLSEGQENKNNEYFEQIKQFYYQSDSKGLERLAMKLNFEQESLTIEQYKKVVACLLKKMNKEVIEVEDINYFKDYLFHVSQWSRYEYRLFSLCAIFFDIKTLQWTTTYLVGKLNSSNEYRGYDEDVSRSLIHLIITLVKNAKYKEAKHYLYLAEDMIENTTLIYEKSLLDLLEGVLMQKTGENMELAQQKIDNTTHLFEYYKIPKIIDLMKSEIEN